MFRVLHPKCFSLETHLLQQWSTGRAVGGYIVFWRPYLCHTIVMMTDWSCCFLYPPPQMEFGVGKVQMKFLHLLSNEASHSITLHCLNDPPYSTADSFSSTGPIHKENTTLQFHGWNKQMFEKDTLLEPHVLLDECKVIGRTVIQQTFILLLGNQISVLTGCKFYLHKTYKRGYLLVFDLHDPCCYTYVICQNFMH